MSGTVVKEITALLSCLQQDFRFGSFRDTNNACTSASLGQKGFV